MAVTITTKCHRHNTTTTTNANIDNIASLILKDHRSSHSHRFWTSFSSASFRRRLLDVLACGASSSHLPHNASDLSSSDETETETDSSEKRAGSGKLSDLLQNASSSSEWSDRCDAEIEEARRRKKVEALEEMKDAVRRLGEGRDEVLKAASDIRRLAKDDAFARETLAMLGAIPPLVEMLGSDDGDDWKVASLYALLNLGIGNDRNKAAIVKAGSVHKMLHIIRSANGRPHCQLSEAIVANFLGLSALDDNKLLIGSSGAVPFLANTVMDVQKITISSLQEKQDALRALYNLSILHSNIPFILETDLIAYLVNALGDMEVSDRILSILSNVVSTPEGRRAVSKVQDAFPILVDVLNWNDLPECQEKVLYVLMVMSHKVYGDRQAMVEAGIMSVLLELTLVGSTLAQKRASRILDCLSLDKGKRISERCNGGLSARLSDPIYGSSSPFNGSNWDTKEGLDDDQDMMSEEKKAVNQLVQQSLQSNMTRIVQRANLPQDFVPSEHFKTLSLSSTSKSLPF